MTYLEIITLVVTGVGVISFSAIFTLLYNSYAKASISELQAGKRDVELIDDAIYSRQPNVRRRNKIFATIKQVLFWLALAIIIPILGFNFFIIVNDGVTFIGNRAIMVVASGSMSKKNPSNIEYLSTLDNQFDTYSIIILEKVEDERQLNTYDVIAYKNDKNVNIIHRIIKIETSNAGDVSYIMRGDSNSSNDTYKPTLDDVIGKYTGVNVPFLGLFIMFLQSYAGILTIVAIIYCLIMVERITNKVNTAQDERLKILEQQINFAYGWNSDDVKSVFNQTIYFKGFAYVFDEKGFVEKREITDEESKNVCNINLALNKISSKDKNGD